MSKNTSHFARPLKYERDNWYRANETVRLWFPLCVINQTVVPSKEIDIPDKIKNTQKLGIQRDSSSLKPKPTNWKQSQPVQRPRQQRGQVLPSFHSLIQRIEVFLLAPPRPASQPGRYRLGLLDGNHRNLICSC
jgi:hypothetical protein